MGALLTSLLTSGMGQPRQIPDVRDVSALPSTPVVALHQQNRRDEPEAEISGPGAVRKCGCLTGVAERRPGPSSADQCAEAQIAEKTVIQQLRPPAVCLGVSACADDDRGIDRSSAGDSDWLAPRGLPSLLALEIAAMRWTAEKATADTPAHSRHEHRKPTLGCAADPWRTPQARHRCWADHGCQVHGEATTAVPGLEDVPAQSPGWHRVDGFIRGSDDLVRFVVWVCDPATSPPRDPMAGCHRTSNSRMAGPSGHRGLRMGEYATLHSSRPGRDLWRRFGPASSSDGHPRSADRGAIAMAERLLRKADRLDPAGLP